MKTDLFLMALSILNEAPLTEELLDEILKKLKLFNPEADGDEIQRVRSKLESQIGVRATTGIGLKETDQTPWLDQRKAANPNWDYWDAYRTWIQKGGFNSDVIRVLDEDTDAILGECGDPQKEGNWSIKGLVMGDVQSGKTANYAGLINKAADVGYKVIILLTGMIEELRAQTQSRLDEDFAGIDSQRRMQKENKYIGVGLLKNRPPPAVLTSVDKDFLTDNLRIFGGVELTTLASQEPVLLVLKKNTTVLRSLHNYLKSQVRKGNTNIDLPLLLIDDEADNASVNTKTEDSPATINKLIRDIRETFNKSTYCAYTATPFANVFIDPDNNNNLFPENFIYTLHAPTSYVGAASIFLDGGKHSSHLVDIDDAENFFPEKHKKDHEVLELPETLKDAIRAFFITCCLRDLRKENLKHRSMLINVSRFTDVQTKLASIVSSYVYDLQQDIRQYIASDNNWKKHQILVDLEASFNTHFIDSGTTWEDIRVNIWSSVSAIKTVTVNQKSQETERLNYQNFKSSSLGRRVIAIGGLTLSRGLTLEGLSTSYFYRNSKSYDTLLQMGRWFGYRNGYEDLCKIWMSSEVQEWYAHLAEVVDELRQDIRSMHARNKKPRDFGIRVLSHPGTLLVTAKNKMKSSKEVEVRISFSKFMTETAYILKSKDLVDRNLDTTLRFIDSLGTPNEHKGRRIWLCTKETIANFIANLRISTMNNAFVPSTGEGEHPLIKFIRESSATKMQLWDVALPQGEADALDHIKIQNKDGELKEFKPRLRQFEVVGKSTDYLKINRGRVGGIDDETIGLPDETVEFVKAEWLKNQTTDKKKAPSGAAFREMRTRPLLTINLIVPTDPRIEDRTATNPINTKKIQRPTLPASEVGTGPFVAISLTFPNLDDATSDEASETVVYRLNKVALIELGLIEEDDDDATD